MFGNININNNRKHFKKIQYRYTIKFNLFNIFILFAPKRYNTHPN
jgi:hypothetical protein